jgi:hypothetical protein
LTSKFQSAIITEAVTVREERMRAVLGIRRTPVAYKFFDIKILPASACAP